MNILGNKWVKTIVLPRALGVMLYSMLHRGRSPWDKYKQQGNLELALAISNPHNKIFFHQMSSWQRQRYLVNKVAEANESVGGDRYERIYARGEREAGRGREGGGGGSEEFS